MADNIEIQLGNDIVRVPRWATEETAKEMVKYNAASAKAMTEMLRLQNKNSKVVVDNQKLFKNMQQKTRSDQKEAGKVERKLVDLKKKHGKMYDSVSSKVKKTGNAIGTVFSKEGLAGVAAALAGLGILGTAAGFAVSALDNFAKSVTTLSNVGIGLGTSLVDLRQQAALTGLSIDDYGKLVMGNGDAIRALGISAQDGARQFSVVSNEARVVAREFNNFGMTNQEFNEVLLQEIELRRKSGMLQTDITNGLADSMSRLLMETTALSAITGQDRREMLRRRQEMMDDSAITAFRLSVEKAGGTLSENFGSLATVFGAGGDIGAQLGQAIAHSLATGLDYRVVNQGAFAQIASLNTSAGEAMDNIAEFVRSNIETMDTTEFNVQLTSMLAELGRTVSADDLRQLSVFASTGVEGANQLISLIAELQGLETSVANNRKAHADATQGIKDSDILALPATIQEMANQLKASALTTVLGTLEVELDDAGEALIESLRGISDNFGVGSTLGEGLKESYHDLTSASDRLKHAFIGLAGAVALASMSYGGRRLGVKLFNGLKGIGGGGGGNPAASRSPRLISKMLKGGKNLFSSGKSSVTNIFKGIGAGAAWGPLAALLGTIAILNQGRMSYEELLAQHPELAGLNNGAGPGLVQGRYLAERGFIQDAIDIAKQNGTYRMPSNLETTRSAPESTIPKFETPTPTITSPSTGIDREAEALRNYLNSIQQEESTSSTEIRETNRILRRLLDAFENQ